MKPVVDGLSDRYENRVEFRILNVDDSRSEAVRLANRLGIQYVPTFVFFNADGSEAGRIVGETPESALTSRLDALK